MSMAANLAVITPWPPQHTGIADYAYDLVFGLVQQGISVTVICETQVPMPLQGVDFYPPEWFTDSTRGQFDEIIYQIGNNTSYHIFQLPLLFKFPGIVHLHDMVLHHLMAWLLYDERDFRLYGAVLAKWYGPSMALEATKLAKVGKHLVNTSKVSDVPFFEEVVQYATSIITHSEFAAKKVTAVFPEIPIMVVPQLYREVNPRTLLDPQAFHIGIFGGMDPNKRLDVLFDALLAVYAEGCLVHLHIVGKVHPDCEHLIEWISQSPLSASVHIHGRVEHETFLQLISAVDLCVALRFPTMGETSAVVMRALQAGTPVVVNDVGWYAELPGFLPKLRPAELNEAEELAELIKMYSCKGQEYRRLMAQTRQFAEAEWQFDDVVRRYADFVMDGKLAC